MGTGERFGRWSFVLVTGLLWLHTLSAQAKPPKTEKSAVKSESSSSKPDRVEKKLEIKHRHAPNRNFRWSTTIAMLAGFMSRQPVRSCEVANHFDRAANGGGECCPSDDAGADTEDVSASCHGGIKPRDATEVMNWKYQLHAAEMERTLTWDEIVDSIDQGLPVVAARFPKESRVNVTRFTYDYFNDVVWVSSGVETIQYEVMLITGYSLDPSSNGATKRRLHIANAVNYGITSMSYDELKGGRDSSFQWRLSWAFGDLTKRELLGAPKDIEPVVATGPATALLQATIPTLPEGNEKSGILKRVETYSIGVRLCYERALQEGAAPKAAVNVSFVLEKGTPMWLRVTDAEGLTPAATKCISEEVSKLRGLYPASGKFDDQQRIHFEFSKLETGGTPTAATR